MTQGPDEHGGVRLRIGQHNAAHPHQASNALGIKWGETIGDPSCPLMRRWVIEGPLGSVRLHHFMRSDDSRALHDHPWWFITVPLGNGYWDVVPDGAGRTRNWVAPWRPHYRPAGHAHAVDTTGCWTLIITGRKRRDWGFWQGAKFYASRAYFGMFGHAPCE